MLRLSGQGSAARLVWCRVVASQDAADALPCMLAGRFYLDGANGFLPEIQLRLADL